MSDLCHSTLDPKCLCRVHDAHDRYKILPLGSFSRIEEIPASKGSYELCVPLFIPPATTDVQIRFIRSVAGKTAAE